MDNDFKRNEYRDGFSVSDGIHKLRILTTNIHHLGLLIVMSTGGSIASFTYLLSTLRRINWIFPDPFYLLSLFTLVSVTALILRDSISKTGESLFEELSDEVQWFVLHEKSREMNVADAIRPPLEIRYELRRFARNTDLPLFSGSAGTTIYALLNITLLLAGAYVSFVIRINLF